MSPLARHAAAWLVSLGLVGPTVAACSLGEGQGSISGTISAPNCWSGPFQLTPDFFAGVPYRDSLQLRIQSGGDFQTFSDGISVLIDDIHAIRPDRGPGLLGQPLVVSLPPEVTPPGIPIKPVVTAAGVHLALYLQRTCPTQNVALYAIDQVMLNADGSCDTIDVGNICPIAVLTQSPTDGGVNDAGADANSISDAGVSDAAVSPGNGPTAQSTMTFFHLFDGDEDETNAAERLTEATFDVYLADPREICSASSPPPRCRGHLQGNFKFYFQRGRPAQPFP